MTSFAALQVEEERLYRSHKRKTKGNDAARETVEETHQIALDYLRAVVGGKRSEFRHILLDGDEPVPNPAA